MRTVIFFNLTNDDTVGAKTCVSTQCPVAKALLRGFPSGYGVTVGLRDIHVYNKWNQLIFRGKTSPKLYTQIRSFDDDQIITPGKYSVVGEFI